MPETPRAIDSLMDALLTKFPGAGGLEFFGVDADSRFRRCLERANSVRRSFLVEHRPGLHRIDLISLPDSFEKFLAKYDSKKRYNLKRQLRVARESVGGDLVLERIERPDQVFGFLKDVAALNGPNGAEPCPNEVELYRDLADRGLLLGYVLKAAGRPIACLMGNEYGETYMVDWTRYNREFRELSPGTTMLYLAIEDLIRQQRFTLINLGYGSPKCEFRSTNSSVAFLSFWLIRKTWTSQFLIHFRDMVHGGVAACRSMVLNEPRSWVEAKPNLLPATPTPLRRSA